MGPAPRAAVVLDVSQHCVETAARYEHRRLTDELLRGGGAEPDAEARLALLQEFLEQTDFRALRAARPELAGGTQGKVVLSRPTASGPHRLTLAAE